MIEDGDECQSKYYLRRGEMQCVSGRIDSMNRVDFDCTLLMIFSGLKPDDLSILRIEFES